MWQHVWGEVGCLMTALLQISRRMWKWKNFENQTVFDKVMRRLRWLTFFGPPCILAYRVKIVACSGSYHGRTRGFRWTSSNMADQVVHWNWMTTAMHVLRSYRATRPDATLNITLVALNLTPTSLWSSCWSSAKRFITGVSTASGSVDYLRKFVWDGEKWRVVLVR